MFIKLTNRLNQDHYYVNPEMIFALCAVNGATEILQVLAPNVGCIKVRETPEQILALIEAEKRKALRDEFAGKVVFGIMRSCDETPGTEVNRDDIAMEAYRMADAMLRAREAK